ncbi:MAG: hypothetical protein QOJ68_1754 [Blastococcus sp.]|nr:hypothetical protein [Blastococcus sp.]
MATPNVSPADPPVPRPAQSSTAGAASLRSVRRSGPHRHRATTDGSDRSRLGLLWTLAALGLTGLLAAAALRRATRPGEGVSAANGFLLAHTGNVPGVSALSPDGVAAMHLALYATFARAFRRYDVLVPAGRELLLVSAVLSAGLMWRVASRLGLGSAAAAVAIVLTALPLLLPATALLDVPAQLAVPWVLAAAWAATAGRRRLRPVFGLPALAVAALLAPPVLIPALAAAAMATFPAGRVRRHPLRAAGTVGLAVAAALVATLLAFVDLGRETRPSAAATSAVAPAGLLAVAIAFLVIGGLAGWALSAFRDPAVALVAGGLAALLPLDRLALLLGCLPLAALLAAALLTRLAEELSERGPAALRPALGVGAAAVLAVLTATAVLSLTRGPVSTPSARAPADLLRWTHAQLPPDTPVVTAPVQWAELVRAGADEKQFRMPRPSGNPQFGIVAGPPPPGAAVLTRVPGGPGRPALSVVDRRPGVATAEELARRRSLAAALLANPTTTTGPRAASLLRTATIDPRLLTVLAGLAAEYGVGVRELPAVAGEPGGTLARQALVDRIGSEHLSPGSAASTRLVAWLSAQLPPFHADYVQVTDGGVRIGFRYASAPDALVTRATP